MAHGEDIANPVRSGLMGLRGAEPISLVKLRQDEMSGAPYRPKGCNTCRRRKVKVELSRWQCG